MNKQASEVINELFEKQAKLSDTLKVGPQFNTTTGVDFGASVGLSKGIETKRGTFTPTVGMGIAGPGIGMRYTPNPEYLTKKQRALPSYKVDGSNRIIGENHGLTLVGRSSAGNTLYRDKKGNLYDHFHESEDVKPISRVKANQIYTDIQGENGKRLSLNKALRQSTPKSATKQGLEAGLVGNMNKQADAHITTVFSPAPAKEKEADDNKKAKRSKVKHEDKLRQEVAIGDALSEGADDIGYSVATNDERLAAHHFEAIEKLANKYK